MYHHTGRTKFQSLIDSIATTPSSRVLLHEAVRRWGPSILTPIASALLTNAQEKAQYSAHPHLPNADMHDEVVMLLSSEFNSKPLGLRAALPADVAPEIAEYASHLIANRRAPETMRRYASCFRTIIEEAVRLNTCPYPMSPGGAISVISALALDGATYSTLCAVRDTITMMHDFEGRPNPVRNRNFQHLWHGIRRVVGISNPNRKIALYRDEVGLMIDLARKEGRKDIATMIAVDFEGALRSAELFALRIEDVTRRGDRAMIFIRRSKTDQSGSGVMVEMKPAVGASFDAVAMLDAWIVERGNAAGLLFPGLGDFSTNHNRRTLARWLKGLAAAIGLDPYEVSTHSLRSGYVTTEIELGTSIALVAAHLRHSSPDMLMYYYRPRRLRPNFIGMTAKRGAR